MGGEITHALPHIPHTLPRVIQRFQHLEIGAHDTDLLASPGPTGPVQYPLRAPSFQPLPGPFQGTRVTFHIVDKES
ncbi:hypothetical protein ACKKBG_A25455 [Auxenochlorella protothecoides x Auxenochlorella symbiontica]